MADKPTDSPDRLPSSQHIESEQQEAPDQQTPAASPPAPRQVIEQFERFFAGAAISPIRNPVLDKVNEEHITKSIELVGEESKATRRYRMAYVLIALFSFGLLTAYMMPADKELYQQIVQFLLAFGGGFGAGYGVRHWRG